MIRPAMSRPRAQLLAALGAGLLALAGCGADAKPVRPANNVIRVTLDEYRIVPRSFVVHSGQVTIVATDAGRLTHNVRIAKPAKNPADQPEVLPDKGVATLHPGETGRNTSYLPPGHYRLVCSIANHDDLGQYATLVVKPR
jgi:uncharacterized cupredoxin-like copper-binding protein